MWKIKPTNAINTLKWKAKTFYNKDKYQIILEIDNNLIDHMGNDLSVVNAARVSFGKSSSMDEDNMGVWHLKQGDVKLIKYLAKHKHLSPFGHAFASFHVKAPIFVARQLVKHKFCAGMKSVVDMSMMNLSSMCLMYGVGVVLIRSRVAMVLLIQSMPPIGRR
jgi:hypothetical protein